MATQILATGSTEAASDPITLEDGETAVLMLSPDSAPRSGRVSIQVLGSNDGWVTVAELAWLGSRARYITGPLTVRVRRGVLSSGDTAGVDRA